MRILLLAIFLAMSLPVTAAELTEATFRRLVAATDMPGQFKAIMPHVMQPMLDMVVQDTIEKAKRSGLNSEQARKTTEVTRRHVGAVMDRVVARADEMVSVDDFTKFQLAAWRGVFTEEEVREMVRFYESPVGKKAVRATPVLMNATARDLQGLVAQRTGAIFEEEFEKEKESFAAELQGIFHAEP